MEGIFQNTSQPIYTAANSGEIQIQLRNKKLTRSLIKINDEVHDDVYLEPGDEIKENGKVVKQHDNLRVLDIYLTAGDIVYAQSSVPNEIRFTIVG